MLLAGFLVHGNILYQHLSVPLLFNIMYGESIHHGKICVIGCQNLLTIHAEENMLYVEAIVVVTIKLFMLPFPYYDHVCHLVMMLS